MNQMAENLKGHRAAIELNIRDLETQAIAFNKPMTTWSLRLLKKRGQRKLAETQEKLVSASRQAGMAEVATGVLHNVGNVLNSVNVSANLINEELKPSNLAASIRQSTSSKTILVQTPISGPTMDEGKTTTTLSQTSWRTFRYHPFKSVRRDGSLNKISHTSKISYRFSKHMHEPAAYLNRPTRWN